MLRLEQLPAHVGLGHIMHNGMIPTIGQSPFIFDADLNAWVRVYEDIEIPGEGTDIMSDKSQADLWFSW
jgi:hypothetical protein